MSGSVVISDLCVWENDLYSYDFQVIYYSYGQVSILTAHYTFQIQFLIDTSGIWWRGRPETQYCEQNAIALSPGKIDAGSIALNYDTKPRIEAVAGIKTQYKITLGLTWEPPEPLHGANEYEITIADRHVNNNDSGVLNPFTKHVNVGVT